MASSNTAAASQVLDLLRHAFSYARRKCEWKLAAKSARALTVAALHFVPGAVSSPLVALLAHSSLGRARHAFATSNDSNSLLSRAMAGVDDLLMGFHGSSVVNNQSHYAQASQKAGTIQILRLLPLGLLLRL